MSSTTGEVKETAIGPMMDAIGVAARRAAGILAHTSSASRNEALALAAAGLRREADTILRANSVDVDTAVEREVSSALLDRLRLDADRVEAMARALEAIVDLPDPVGRVMHEWSRPNGLQIQRVAVPLGVIGIIYESRPNVTADAGALCLKSGNAVILRGGSESYHSSTAIHAVLAAALERSGLPVTAIQMIPTTDRAAVGYLLGEMSHYVDVVVPRGGKSLIARVQRDARVPVIGHLEGLCHVYVDGDADPTMAREIVLNAKMRRTGICGAAETLLVDRRARDTHLPVLVRALLQAGCELRGDADAQAADARVLPATEEDWYREYLDAVMSVRTVDGVDGALEHIAAYGSGHTDAIVTDDPVAAERFLQQVDSAIVLHNASTQFADGGEFGMGAEIGISTGRIHARGPVGVEQLTSYKYCVRGSGQVRPP